MPFRKSWIVSNRCSPNSTLNKATMKAMLTSPKFVDTFALQEYRYKCSRCKASITLYDQSCGSCETPNKYYEEKNGRDLRAGDWYCIGCNSLNMAPAFKCKTCGVENAFMKELKASLDQENFNRKNRLWVCKSRECGITNDPAR